MGVALAEGVGAKKTIGRWGVKGEEGGWEGSEVPNGNTSVERASKCTLQVHSKGRREDDRRREIVKFTTKSELKRGIRQTK